MAKEVTVENVAAALYLFAQMAGTSGDYGPLRDNPDQAKKFERQAKTLLSNTDGTQFCRDFIELINRDFGDVAKA